MRYLFLLVCTASFACEPARSQPVRTLDELLESAKRTELALQQAQCDADAMLLDVAVKHGAPLRSMPPAIPQAFALETVRP